eukprot:EG_transcript_6045
MPAEDFTPVSCGLAANLQQAIALSAQQWWRARFAQRSAPADLEACIDVLFTDFEPVKCLQLGNGPKRSFAEHLVRYLTKDGPPPKPTPLLPEPQPSAVSPKAPVADKAVRFQMDDRQREEPGLPLHPCLRQYPDCRYGPTCVFAQFPRSTCVWFLKGTCHRGAACSYRHVEWGDMTEAQRRDMQRKGGPLYGQPPPTLVTPAETPRNGRQSPTRSAGRPRPGGVGYAAPRPDREELFEQALRWWRQRPPSLPPPANLAALRRELLEGFPDLRGLPVPRAEREEWAGKLAQFLADAADPYDAPRRTARPSSPGRRTTRSTSPVRRAAWPPDRPAERPEQRPHSPPPYHGGPSPGPGRPAARSPPPYRPPAPETRWDGMRDREPTPPDNPYPYSCVKCGKPYVDWASCLAHMRRRRHLPPDLELPEERGPETDPPYDFEPPTKRPRKRSPSPLAETPAPLGLQETQEFLAQLFGRARAEEPGLPSGGGGSAPLDPAAPWVLAPSHTAAAYSGLSSAPPTPAPPSPAAPPAAPAVLRFCPECGSALPPLTPLARFCMTCGASLLPYLT